jgi:ABC-type polar amino acid transport system ATPase subunit
MLKLTKYRVTGFRSVKDSGWIETDTVTAMIGVNESGKTNLILPLWKMRPANEGKIVPIADYPRTEYNDWRQQDQSRVFVHAQFEADDELAEALAMPDLSASQELRNGRGRAAL